MWTDTLCACTIPVLYSKRWRTQRRVFLLVPSGYSSTPCGKSHICSGCLSLASFVFLTVLLSLVFLPQPLHCSFFSSFPSCFSFFHFSFSPVVPWLRLSHPATGTTFWKSLSLDLNSGYQHFTHFHWQDITDTAGKKDNC